MLSAVLCCKEFLCPIGYQKINMHTLSIESPTNSNLKQYANGTYQINDILAYTVYKQQGRQGCYFFFYNLFLNEKNVQFQFSI